MRTYTPKADEIQHDWWLVDATDKPLGRLAVEIAKLSAQAQADLYAILILVTML